MTRVIYPAEQSEVSVKVSNRGLGPVLLQSWIDTGDTKVKPEELRVPFILTPPIARVEPNKAQSLRISYNQSPLPTDRESVFWLNVLEIPPKPKEAKSGGNFMQIAFRSRIKLFFRPKGLSGDANQAGQALTWQAKGKQLLVTNPTPYHVSLTNITLVQGGQRYTQEADMVAPLASQELTLKALPESIKAGSKLIANYINDYGGEVSAEQLIKE